MKTATNNIILKNNITPFFVAILAVALIFFTLLATEKITVSPFTLVAIAILSSITIIILAFLNPTQLLLLFIAYLPFSYVFPGGFGIQTWAINATNVFILAMLMGAFSQKAKYNIKLFPRSSLSLWLFIFIILIAASFIKGTLYFGAFYFERFISSFKEWLTPILTFFIVLPLIKNKNDIKDIAIVTMCVITIVGLITIRESINLGFSSDIDKMRAGSIFEQPNIAGSFFVYYSFLFMGFILFNLKRLRYWLLSAPLLLAVRALTDTYSRGAMLAFIAGSLFVAFIKNKLIFVLLIFAFLAALFIPGIMPETVKQRFQETFIEPTELYQPALETTLETSASSRIKIWKGAWEMIKAYPLFGVGYGVFPHMISSYAEVGRMDAHNAYIIIAAEMGLITLAVFLVILLIIFRNTLWVYKRVNDKTVKAVALGFLGGFIGFLVCNLFGSRFETQSLSGIFWILTAAMVKARYLKIKGQLD
ncbi:MAG: O-antigen ligase family protein [Candidatus Omnitrophota bacterium]|nr:O-antigen ligase family protein [Candidatus Omnitrophota bacterium]